jgi:hypothetical protein
MASLTGNKNSFNKIRANLTKGRKSIDNDPVDFAGKKGGLQL